jgi:hypothetical protein
MQRLAHGRATAREITAFPSFLRSPGMNEILSQLTKLETDRTRLLERLTDTAPEITALNRSIKELEQQLVPLGGTYLSSLDEQQKELRNQLSRREALIATLPASAQRFLRLQRDVKRLSETSIALEAQLLMARLATIGEGGEARPLDWALPPKRVSFPRPLWTIAAGLGGGLVLGAIAVLVAGFLSPRIESAVQVTRLLGLPAARIGRGSALFHAACQVDHGIAVVPVDAAADAHAVATWLTPRIAPSAPVPAAVLSRAGVTVVGERANGGAPNGYDPLRLDPGPTDGQASAPTVLPPLASPEGVAAVSRAGRVVLAVSSRASREQLADAVAAVRLAGAEPVAVVLA